MHMDNIEIFDLVKYVNENQPIDFAASLDKLLSQRAIDVLAAKKEELAQTMFNAPDDEDEDEVYDEDELQQALDDIDDIDAEEDFDFESTEEQEDGESDD